MLFIVTLHSLGLNLTANAKRSSTPSASDAQPASTSAPAERFTRQQLETARKLIDSCESASQVARELSMPNFTG